MNGTKGKAANPYRPVIFTAGVFAITWICAVLMTKIDSGQHVVLLYFLDFLENASPLIFALILLKGRMLEKGFLLRFVFGEKKGFLTYGIVLLLFLVQFLNFYLFQTEGATLSLSVFGVIFLGQLLLGGGLEEGGWRGYLLPALERKLPLVPASVLVSTIWVLWHIPYFILPGGMHSDGNFVFYSIIGIVTGFILTAIYKLTKSVLLCTLFHSWQNTIVMTIQADMQNPGFLAVFLLLGIGAVGICLYMEKKENRAAP